MDSCLKNYFYSTIIIVIKQLGANMRVHMLEDKAAGKLAGQLFRDDKYYGKPLWTKLKLLYICRYIHVDGISIV